MKRSSVILSSLVLATTLLNAACAAPPATAPVGERKLEDVPKLTVRGQAELEKPADQVRMRVGVVTKDTEAADALRENTRRMKAVIAELERVGINEGEYETGQFRLRPEYSRRPRGAQNDWQPEIIGYEVVNSVTIKTTRLELTGTVIEAANKAGANSVNVESFELADPRVHRAEAIRTATQYAIADAEALADAASLELVRIVAINLDSAPIGVARMEMATQRAMAADSAPPIVAGDVTVRASVNVIYEIRPKSK